MFQEVEQEIFCISLNKQFKIEPLGTCNVWCLLGDWMEYRPYLFLYHVEQPSPNLRWRMLDLI